MADATWPTTLPTIEDIDWEAAAETLPDLTIRTNMDAGPPKVRRRFTSGNRDTKRRIEMTPAQVLIFEEFYLNTLSGGSLPFNWTNPRSNATEEYNIVNRVKYNPVAGFEYFVVEFDLEELP